MAQRLDLPRLTAWIAILLLSLYLVFVGGSWVGIYVAPIRQASVALAGMALVAWAIVALVRPAWRPRSVLLVAIVACLASLAISTATSRYPRISVEYLGYALLLAALYLLLVRLLALPFFRARFGALAVDLCLGLSAAFLYLVLLHWIDWWGVVGHLTIPPLRPAFESLTFGNPSAVLTITVLFLCPAIAHIGTGSATRRVVVMALVAVVALVVVLSGSRAGWLALVAAGAVVGAMWSATERGRATIRAAARAAASSGGVRWGVVVATGLGVVALFALAPALVQRATGGGVELRAGYLVAAFRMFIEAPVIGTGPGTWVVQRARYTLPPETDYYIPHAHDVYAQTLSELGLVGGVAGIVLAVSLAWLILGAIRDEDATRRRWGWAAAFSLIYLGAHQILDFYANMPAVLFAAALPVAWLDASASSVPHFAGRTLPVRLGVAPAAIAAIFVVVAIAGLEWVEIPAGTHAQAIALANAGDWAAADAPARSAVAMDPSIPPYLMTEGLTAARAGDHARAADAFGRVAIADDLPEAWLDLAAEDVALGDHASAREAIANALRLGYQRPVVAMAAGDLALRLGHGTLAQEAFTNALVATPSLAGDPWWTADPARATLFPALRDAAIAEADPARGWEIALVSGDAVRARSLAERLDPAAAAEDTRIIAAWSGDDAALQAVLNGCAARPLDVSSLLWCARLEGRRGNVVQADRYRAWANTIIGNAYVAGAELRVRSDLQVGRSEAGSPALFYGYYTYRRPTPWDLLVPSLLHLTLE